MKNAAVAHNAQESGSTNISERALSIYMLRATAPAVFNLRIMPDGTILGATIAAPHAGEMITEFMLALQHGLKIRDLAEAMHVYPAYSMGVQRAAQCDRTYCA